jgi:hypothetical protein
MQEDFKWRSTHIYKILPKTQHQKCYSILRNVTFLHYRITVQHWREKLLLLVDIVLGSERKIVITSYSYRSDPIGIVIASYNYRSKVMKSLLLLAVMLLTGFILITTPRFSPSGVNLTSHTNLTRYRGEVILGWGRIVLNAFGCIKRPST